MLRIVFEYRDEYTRGRWSTQECVVSSMEQCKKLYGLGVDCEYRIISVEEVTEAEELYYKKQAENTKKRTEETPVHCYFIQPADGGYYKGQIRRRFDTVEDAERYIKRNKSYIDYDNGERVEMYWGLYEYTATEREGFDGSSYDTNTKETFIRGY